MDVGGGGGGSLSLEEVLHVEKRRMAGSEMLAVAVQVKRPRHAHTRLQGL